MNFEQLTRNLPERIIIDISNWVYKLCNFNKCPYYPVAINYHSFLNDYLSFVKNSDRDYVQLQSMLMDELVTQINPHRSELSSEVITDMLLTMGGMLNQFHGCLATIIHSQLNIVGNYLIYNIVDWRHLNPILELGLHDHCYAGEDSRYVVPKY